MPIEEVVTAGGVRLALQQRQNPESTLTPVLLIHGLASNLRLWDGVATALAGVGHPVAAVDLRGHGTSAKPDQGYDFATLTDDLVAVVDALEYTRPVVVVGQSMGAELAVELAWRFPDRLRGVACIDGGWLDLQARFPDWERCLATLSPPVTTGRPRAEIETFLRSHHPDWPEAGIQGALACFEHRPDGTVAPWLARPHHLALLRAMWDRRPSTRFPEVAVPVLLVPAGDGSPASDHHDAVAAAARALPQAQVEWMAGDHDLHAQHPEALGSLVHRWVTTTVDPPLPAPTASDRQTGAPAAPSGHQIGA